MRTQTATALMMTCLLLIACFPGIGEELNEEPEKSNIGPNTSTTAWGVSYDWSELPNDIKDLTGIDIQQLLLDLEDAALDGHINLDLDYGINGSTYYYVVQSQGESTEIDLAGSGGDVDVDAIDTTITLRMAVESTMGADFDWSEDDVGFDFDLDSFGNNAIIIDIEMTEYYTDDFHFAGMDLSVAGGMSYGSSMSLDADIYAGNDHITFENTTVSMSMDYTITELTAEWRMEEESTIYEDILSGNYDVIHWYCDSYYDESERYSWSESSNYEILETGSNSDDEGDFIATDHYYDNDEYQTWNISDPNADGIRLNWDHFDTEFGYDKVTIVDANTGTNLDEFSGYMGGHTSPWYDTNSITIEWESDFDTTNWGFELNYWESGTSAGKEQYLQLIDACGEVDYDWDVGFGYDLSLSNFPASDLGFTSDQISFSLSDSLIESGSENNEDIGFSHTINIVDHNYEITNPDGTTREVVRVEGGGPMFEAIGGVVGMGMALAIEDSDYDDINEDLEDASEDWGDDYDEGDDETMDIAEDFEDTDIDDDMEEMSEEFEEVLEDIEDDMESKYSETRMYWLIDKETGNQIGPQVLALDADDDDWVQMIGPESEIPAPAEEDSFDLEYHEGEDAEDMQEDVADLSEEELLEDDPLAESDSGKEGESDAMMTYLMTGGIALVAILLLGILGMMLMRRNRDKNMWDDSEHSVNQAFNQTAYDMIAAEMGAGMTPTSGPPTSASPPSGPPATMRGAVKDGFEWAEYPPGSGTWYYRDAVTNQWVRHE